jgi:hypothetical protein
MPSNYPANDPPSAKQNKRIILTAQDASDLSFQCKALQPKIAVVVEARRDASSDEKPLKTKQKLALNTAIPRTRRKSTAKFEIIFEKSTDADFKHRERMQLPPHNQVTDYYSSSHEETADDDCSFHSAMGSLGSY